MPLPSLVNRPRIAGGCNSEEVGVMNKATRYSPEVRERAIRMVLEHEHKYFVVMGAIVPISEKVSVQWVGRRPSAPAPSRVVPA